MRVSDTSIGLVLIIFACAVLVQANMIKTSPMDVSLTRIDAAPP